MKKILLFTGLWLLAAVSFAQHPGFSKLYHYSGDTLPTAELINTLLFDSVNQKLYFNLASLRTPNHGSSTTFLRTDLQGNVEREVFDTVTGADIYQLSLAESRDGNFLYWGGGGTYHSGFSETGFWVLTKTDKELNVVWRKLYPTNALIGHIMEIVTNKVDDDILLLCEKATPVDNPYDLPTLPNRVYIRKVDSGGNLLSEYMPGPSYWNTPAGMAVTNDGGYLVCGRTYSWGQNNGNAFSMKVDTSGDEVWHQLYFQDHDSEWPHHILKSREPQERYLIVGEIQPSGSDVSLGFINKIDDEGNELWRRILAQDSSLTHVAGPVANCLSGGYIIGGSMNTGNNPTQCLGWLVRMDNDGNKRWGRTVTHFTRDTDLEYLYRVVSLPDGSFVAAGSSWGQNPSGRWNQEGWLVRVDSNGCVDPNCSGDLLSVQDQQKALQNVACYPNPASDKVILESGEPFSPGAIIKITDNLGRVIKTINARAANKKIELDLHGVSSGIYMLRLENKDGKYYQQKITILR